MKEMSFCEKIEILQPVLYDILNDIRKELKNEHLRKDFVFTNKFFAKKAIEKVTVAELVEGYLNALREGNEEAGEWIASRWMLKHPEVYQFFAEQLSAINPKFDEIERIADGDAEKIKDKAVETFGPKVTYIFSVLNSVAFPEFVFEDLKNKAASQVPTVIESDTMGSVEELKKKYETSLAKLIEKYEKRLQSLEKKYVQDMEGYKKQIASLQRRLS